MNNLQEKVIRRMIDTYGFFTTDELSEMTGVSVSSIKHSLSDISHEIEKYEAKLLTAPRKGLCLVATEEQREMILDDLNEYANKDPESFYYRKNYILDTLFYYPAKYTIQLFAEELCVSRNIIQKDLKHIENYLSEFNLTLTKVRNQGIQIKGDEFDLRQAIVDSENKKYWKHAYIEKLPENLDYRISKRAYTFFTDHYSKENIMKVQDSLRKAEEFLNQIFVDISFCRLTEYLLLTINRIGEGKILQNAGSRKMTKLDTSFLDAARLILDEVIPQNGDMAFEYQFLAAKLMVAKTCGHGTRPKDEKYENIALDYLSIVLAVMKKENVLKNEILINDISSFLEKITIKRDYKLVEWDDLHRDVQHQLQDVYAACMTYIFDIEGKLSVILTQDEIAWIALLVHNAMMDSREGQQAVLLTATDPHTARYQKIKIENAVEGLEIIDSIHIRDFHPETMKGQLLISTVPLKEPRENTIEVTKHIDQADINKIAVSLDELDHDQKMTDALETTKKTFRESLILTDVNVMEKQDVIQLASDLLYEQGFIEKGFSQEVWKRELKRPSTVGRGIVMPHIYKDYVKQSGVAVVRLKYPISWTPNEKVRMMFLIAIDFETSEEILRFFQYFYAMIGNKELIGHLLDAEGPKEFYEILMSEAG